MDQDLLPGCRSSSKRLAGNPNGVLEEILRIEAHKERGRLSAGTLTTDEWMDLCDAI